MTTSFLKASNQPENSCNLYACFRALVPGGTEIKLYADQFYELYLNGTFTAYGPVKSGSPLFYYDTFRMPDADTFVAIRIHGRKRPPELWIESDSRIEWKASSLHAYASNAPRNVGEVGYSEYYDFQEEESLWFAPDFPDSDWKSPQSGRTVPRSHFRERPIPMFKPVVRKPRSVQRNEDGFLVDFGEMVYGRVFLAGTMEKGKTLELNYLEDLTCGWAAGEGRKIMYSDRLLNAPPEIQWHSFSKRGFRCLLLSGAALDHPDLWVEEYPYPANFVGTFECSDDRLNRLWTISERTLRICMDEIYNDCPHRDQAQWMDAFVSSKVAFALSGDTKLARKCLLQHGICSFVDGKFLSPSIVGGGYLPDYALVLIQYILWYCRVSGDLSILDELYDHCVAGMNHFHSYQDSDHLLNHVSDTEFAYLDNAFELCRLGKSAALNALYYGALNSMAALAELYGADSACWKKEAELVRESYSSVFAHPTVKGCFRDSDSRPEQDLWNLNFSCEFGRKWVGSSARAVFRPVFESEQTVIVKAGAYGPFRMRVNGMTVLEDRRSAQWMRPAPCYDLRSVEVCFHAGENEVVFETECNGLNWDLFFSGFDPSECEIQEIDKDTGAATGTPHRTKPRFWTPPLLSQTTHGYAAFCGLAGGDALRKTLSDHYVRNYISIRVPLFSEETTDPDRLKGWILPANTPWTGFFFLSGLFDHGLGREALEWIRRAWGVMLDRHAVNTWEEWNCNASLCHAWGASPCYFFTHGILGVKTENAAKKQVEIRPELFDLQYASGTVALSETEVLRLAVRREENGSSVRLEVPEGWFVAADYSHLPGPVMVI